MGIKANGVATISFSELQTYLDCAFKHKLSYLQGEIPKEESPALAYGTSIHEGIQSLWTNSIENSAKIFEEKLYQTFENITKDNYENYKETGKKIITNFTSTEYLKHELVKAEYQLRESIIPDKLTFTGFIDVFLKIQDTSRFKIVDFKSTSKGWTKKDRNNPIKKLQLLLYKKFLVEKLGIDPNMIDCEFVLLRGSDCLIETLPVSSTVEELNHAHSILLGAVKLIYQKRITDLKDPSSCFFCRWNKKEYCDRVSTINESEDYLTLRNKLTIL